MIKCQSMSGLKEFRVWVLLKVGRKICFCLLDGCQDEKRRSGF
jgi:hypothetical protein